jgi:hypothetical protein
MTVCVPISAPDMMNAGIDPVTAVTLPNQCRFQTTISFGTAAWHGVS